jgi:hypothetical protein
MTPAERQFLCRQRRRLREVSGWTPESPWTLEGHARNHAVAVLLGLTDREYAQRQMDEICAQHGIAPAPAGSR